MYKSKINSLNKSAGIASLRRNPRASMLACAASVLLMFGPVGMAESESQSALKMIGLAKQKFGTLTEPEQRLFRAVANGEIADYSAEDPNDNQPADANKWGPERVFDANRIQWLCTDKEALELVTHLGILVEGARIDGVLVLQFAKIPFPLYFKKCALPRGVNLENSEVQMLNLDGTHTGPIRADGLRVEGSVLLRHGFKAEGEVNLVGAAIGRDLDCTRARFVNPDGIAIKADTLSAKGCVFLYDHFRSEGKVRLFGATIGGDLNCAQGQFIDPNGAALGAARASVIGTVFLSLGFRAEGKVDLINASIGGALDCTYGRFINPNGYALTADNVKVEGDVLMRGRFKAEGEVSLIGARIGGALNYTGGELLNEGDAALSADRVKVQGSVSLRDGFKAEGEVRFVSATIGGNLKCDRGQFINPYGDALRGDGLKVEGNVFFRNGFKAEGGVNLIDATVDGYFIWRDVNCPEKVTLDLRSAKIGTLLDDGNSWPKKDKLFLHGLVYDEIDDDAPRDAKKRIEWLRRQHGFWAQPYEQLATVLGKGGDNATATKVLVAKNKDKARLTKLTWSEWFWYRVFGRMIGYGYRPWRAAWIGLVLVLFGWLFFWAGYRAEVMTPAKEAAEASGGFCALVYSLDVFVPLVDLRQAKYWLPSAQGTGELRISEKLSLPVSGKVLRYYLWFEIIAGWVLTTLLVVGLTGLVRT